MLGQPYPKELRKPMQVNSNLNICKLFGLQFFLPFLLSCGTIKEPVFESIESVDITAIKDSVITADAKVRIRNENKMSYSGNKVEMRIYHKNILVATGKAVDGFQIPSDDTVSFFMKLEFHPDSLIDDSFEILYQDSIPLRIEISGEFGALRIPSSAVIDHQLNTAEMLDMLIKENLGKKQVKVEKTYLKDFSTQRSTIVSNIRFKNTLPLDLNIKAVHLDIFADQASRQKISNWKDTVGFEIPQGKDTLLSPEFKINNISTAMTGLFKTITGDNIYYASGYTVVRFRLHEFKVPLRFRFSFDPMNQNTDVLE
jgi:LEA14-like dessication related protein